MGVEDNGNHKMGAQDSVPPQDHLVETPAAEQDGKQRTEGRSGTVPVTVVSSAELVELQRRLAEAEAKLQHQRKKNTEYHQRWRDSHRQDVKDYERERSRRRRANGGSPPQR